MKKALEAADGAELFGQLGKQGKITLSVDDRDMDFSPEEIAVSVSAAEGFAAETGDVGVVVLHTTLTDDLVDEGLLREIVSRVQAERKEQGLDFVDRIRLSIDGSERMLRVARKGEAHLVKECLVQELVFSTELADEKEHVIGEETLRIRVEKV